MVTVLNAPERRPSFSSLLGSSVGSGFSKALGDELTSQMEMRRDLSKALLAGGMKGHSSGGALEALDRLESLVPKKGVGLSGRINPFALTGQGAENRGEFDATLASLLPAFKSLFPRGFTEKEFKTITERYLPAHHDTEATIRGKIRGLRNMVRHLEGGGSPEDMPKTEIHDPNLAFFEEKSIPKDRIEKMRFDISNPEHIAKRNQLMKAFKNDREKVRKALNREFLE